MQFTIVNLILDGHGNIALIKGTIMLSEKEREFARKIGKFYFKKCNEDYNLAVQKIIKLYITKLEFKENTLNITTCRPSLLIGKQGENIDSLSEYLNVNIKIIEETDSLIDTILSFRFDEDSEFVRRENALQQILISSQVMGVNDL